MAETSDMRKPLCVALVEWCFWCLSAVFAVGAVILAVLHGADDLGGLFVSACLVSAALLPAGMALGLRRGRRGWFEGPFVLVMWLLIAPCLSAVLSSRGFDGGVPWSCPVVLIATTLVPIVLLRLPSSSRWFAFKSGGKKSRIGCACLVAAVLFFGCLQQFFFMSDDYPRRRSNAARLWSLSMQGRNIYLLQKRNAEARAAGGDWVDPTSCSNSVDYVSRLVARFDEGIFGDRPPAPVWQIAVNPGEDADLPELVPVMVTANFDTAQIPQIWSGMHEPGVVDLKLRRVADLPACLGDQFVLLVRRCGSVQNFRARYLQPRVVFGKDPWQLPSGMYWLTPTGRTGP